MSVDLIISRTTNGSNIQDKLIDSQVGINHGEVTNNVESLEEVWYIRHNGTEDINNLKVYLENLPELLEWADSFEGFGLLLDVDDDGEFAVNFKTGVGDILANAIDLGNIVAATEKIISIKIKVPGNEDTVGIRNFDLQFNFDYTI